MGETSYGRSFGAPGSGTSVTLAEKGAWVTATAYVAGDVVTKDGFRYIAVTAHASGTFLTDLAAAKWTILTTTALLAFVAYKAGSDGQYNTASTISVDVDATNLLVTFVAPASGVVLVRLNALGNAQSSGSMVWHMRDGSGLVAGSEAIATYVGADSRHTTVVRMTGLTPGTSYTWKWGWRVVSSAGGYIKTGPNNGPAVMEVWAA